MAGRFSSMMGGLAVGPKTFKKGVAEDGLQTEPIALPAPLPIAGETMHGPMLDKSPPD